MPQDIQIGEGQWLRNITRQFWDGGEPAKQAATPGGIVQLSPARRSAPVILQVGEGAKAQFFYQDGKPVTDPAHVTHVPEPYLALALEWIRTRAATAAPLKAAKDKGKDKPGKKRTGSIDQHPRHRQEVDGVATGGVKVEVG